MSQTMMGAQVRQWLTTTSQILHERPERLQKLVLHISRKNPDMGFYAANLAGLRMAGMEMDAALSRLWNADSARHIDEILDSSPLVDHPSSQAVTFLATLIKIDMTRGYRLQLTVH